MDGYSEAHSGTASAIGLKFLRPAALLLLAAFLIAPIWSVPRPPLLDYPNHLARTFVLTHLHDTNYQFFRYFRADWGVYPYVAMDLTLIGLQHIFSVEIAGKMFLSLCILVLPVGMWWFLRQVAPGQQVLALFACALSYEMFFLEGFVNFHLGLGIAFLLLGYWYRFRSQPTLNHWLVTFAFAVLLYFTHLIAFGFAALTIGLHALISSHRKWEVPRALPVFLPGLLFFWIARPGLKTYQEKTFRDFDDKLASLYTVPVHGFSSRTETICLFLLVAAIALALWKNPDVHWNGGLALTWLGLFLIYWLMPQSWGETWDIDVRILPFLFLLVFGIIYLGRSARCVAIIALVMIVLRVTDVAVTFRKESPRLQNLTNASKLITRNSRVLPVMEASDGLDPIQRPFAHYWAYAVIDRGAFAPYLFDIPGQTTLRMTFNGYVPGGFFDSSYAREPNWQQVRETYDYVWAYNVPRFLPSIEKIADAIYRDRDFVLYKVKK